MNIFFTLFFTALSVGSLITTIVAIIQILSNEFKDSKVVWKLVSMVAFIGPILYLTKGRKLIVKKDKPGVRNEKEKFHFDMSFYKNLYGNLNRFTKWLVLISLALIVWGYMARLFSVFVFWESRPIGYMLLIISLVLILNKLTEIRKKEKLKNVWGYIGIGILIFTLFIKLLVFILIGNSEAYRVATEYLRKDSGMKNKLGEITGISLCPGGGLQIVSDSNGEYGTATVSLIVKGSTQYEDVDIHLEKKPRSDWTVITIE